MKVKTKKTISKKEKRKKINKIQKEIKSIMETNKDNISQMFVELKKYSIFEIEEIFALPKAKIGNVSEKFWKQLEKELSENYEKYDVVSKTYDEDTKIICVDCGDFEVMFRKQRFFEENFIREVFVYPVRYENYVETIEINHWEDGEWTVQYIDTEKFRTPYFLRRGQKSIYQYLMRKAREGYILVEEYEYRDTGNQKIDGEINDLCLIKEVNKK